MHPFNHPTDRPGDASADCDRVVDGVIQAFRAGRVRLWMADPSGDPDLIAQLGPWTGLVIRSAERILYDWSPDPQALTDRLARRCEEGATPSAAEAVRELLPLAREELGREMETADVPRGVATLAKSLFSINPPVEQWKM